MKFYITLLACIIISFFSFSQTIPKNPNVIDAKGLRQGKWTLLFDASWNPVNEEGKAVYYRSIEYENDIPKGLVRDYYPSGKVQWEGSLLYDRPEEVMDGESTWYREDGSIEVVRIFERGNQIKEIFFDRHGNEVEENWSSLDQKGRAAYGEGDYVGALEYFIKAREQAEKEFGENHQSYATALTNLAFLYSTQGDYRMTESLYVEATAIYKETLGMEHPEYAISLNNLAWVYQNTNRYEKAETLYIEAKDIRLKVLGKEQPGYAESLNNLGALYNDMGLYERSESLLKEASSIYKKAFGNEHPDYALSLNNQAFRYTQIGDYQKAELLLAEVATIYEKTIGKEHPAYVAVLSNLAALYQTMGLYEKAESLSIEAIDIEKKTLGKEHPEYALLLSNLATLYETMGLYAKAEPLGQEAKTILERTVGKNNLTYAATLNTLALLSSHMEHYEKAEQLYIESKEILEQTVGKEHTYYPVLLNNLATLYNNMKRYEKARVMFTESCHVVQDQVQRYFPSLSGKEKDAFYTSVKTRLEEFCSFALTTPFDQSEMLQDVYNVQLATKGLLFNTDNKTRERILNSKDSSLINLFTEWRTLRTRLAITYQMSVDERNNKGVDLDMLEEEVNNKEKLLSLQSELFRNAVDSRQYVWQDVQRKLKKNEAAVELIRFRKSGVYKTVTDSSNVSLPTYCLYWLTDTIYYAALIVTPTSKVPEVVLLKNGNDLEGRYLNAYKNGIMFKLTDTTSYKTFWKPIAEVLKKKKTKIVYLSIDGVYNSVNINTLYNPETKRYVTDELDLRLITNTNYLITAKDVKKKRGDNASLFGYPDYSGQDTTAIDKDKERNFSFQLDSTQRFFEGGKITQLPGTRAEIKTINGLLTNSEVKTYEYLDRQATEEEVKELRNPKILHIATHGFFLQDLNMVNERTFTGFDTKKVEQNPLLRSGLLLANSQKTIDGFRNPDMEDGILTAYEAMNLNLDETELVVLSACETGLGEIRNGEGVYGLQRAFQTAGAKSVIMSLWKVDDHATQELMTAFYKNWLKSDDKRYSFKKAQTQLRKEYPHPYYWGAFVLVGE